MRRGLMAWDPNEIPIDTLRQRIRRLQSTMSLAGQDAILLYTNFVRSGAVSYLTAFSPYWADGVLLVPREGEPVFATTLSKRVGSWIQSVKPIGELVTSPTPGAVLGQKLAAEGSIHRLAILELDNFPSGLYGEIAAALPGIEIVDGSDTFATARRHLDDVERRLLQRADAMACDALDRLKCDANSTVGIAVGRRRRICTTSRRRRGLCGDRSRFGFRSPLRTLVREPALGSPIRDARDCSLQGRLGSTDENLRAGWQGSNSPFDAPILVQEFWPRASM